MPAQGDDGVGFLPYVVANSPKGGSINSLRSQLQLVKRDSRRLGKAAAVLGMSALAHAVVLVVSGGEWQTAVSFRKPITFGISVGLILWTSAWTMDRLPSRPRLERALTVTLVSSGFLEVGLITVQAWRGVPSHFNVFTPQDGAIFGIMGIAIGVFSVALVVLYVWSLMQRPADPSTRLALLAGFGLVMAGLGLGPWIIGLGLQMTERLGHVPNTVLAGEAGIAKFPHAMALHGIQVFIATSVVARTVGLADRNRLRATRLTVAGYASLVGWSILHTNAGRAPADLTGIETTLVVVGIVLMGAAATLLWTQRAGKFDPATANLPPVTLDS